LFVRGEDDSGGGRDDDTAIEYDGSAFLCGSGFGVYDGSFAFRWGYHGGVSCSLYPGKTAASTQGLLGGVDCSVWDGDVEWMRSVHRSGD
jgi:hypothetical protein